ncbi:hypothetical protein [Sphingomonas paucimobilis]|uniref:Uncharacterized protein n=1 Tax=Sphingomonas paucimobilis TaxID=13689 RepID=A0A7Y2PG41_SPHPI|nr:hypothetical protein [Sphingomonas paucimobilis]NNG59801.1 hypothetical protein [Sphingomonas paucimobilis]
MSGMMARVLQQPDPAADPIAISDAYRLIRSCPEPDRARQELEADIICGDLKPVATRAIYRQSNKTLMPAKNPVPVDGKVWARIEADEQTDAFWTGNVVRLSGSGGGAVDLMAIVVAPARIVEVANRHGAEQATSSRSRPNAGAPVRKHVPAIDFVMRYLRELPEGRRNRLKSTTIAAMLDAAFHKFGGKSIRQRGLEDLAAQVQRELAATRVDAELVAEFDKLAGV